MALLHIMIKPIFIVTIVLQVFLSVTPLLAQSDIDQIPPDDAKKIYQVIDHLENIGVKQVLSIQFDDWIWKAEALQGNNKTMLYMSPDSLVVFKKRQEYELDPTPPLEGKSIRDILEVVESIGYRNIRQITFENLVWKVRTYNKKSAEKKFIIEPVTGAILYKNAHTKRTQPYDIYSLVNR